MLGGVIVALKLKTITKENSLRIAHNGRQSLAWGLVPIALARPVTEARRLCSGDDRQALSLLTL